MWSRGSGSRLEKGSEMKKKDGTYLKVLDHGRIVESGHYGKVFYVLIMDWDSMKEKYRDSL